MKSEESLYETFLSMLDDDLRDACIKTRGIEEALPDSYLGIEDTERLAKALIATVTHFDSECDRWVPEQYLEVVREARELLTESVLAFIALYLPRQDSRLRSVCKLMGMFRHRWQEDSRSTGELVFNELMTGKRRVKTRRGSRLAPSSLKRNTDGEMPYFRRHRDGSHGFTWDDDDAVLLFTRYQQVEQRVYKANPLFNLELHIKRPFELFAGDQEKFYFKEEQVEINFEKKVQGLQSRYALNLSREKGYDLLDRLMIEALLSYLRDSSAPLSARESYIGQVERLIGDESPRSDASHLEEAHGEDRTA